MLFRSGVVILLIMLCTIGVSQELSPEVVIRELSGLLVKLNKILIEMADKLHLDLMGIDKELKRFSQIQTLTNTKIDLHKELMLIERKGNIEKFAILAISLDRIESKLDVIGGKLKAIESTDSNKKAEEENK